MHPNASTPSTLMILGIVILTLSGCGSLRPHSDVHFNNISVNQNGRTQYLAITDIDKQKIRSLADDISNLSPTVDKTEAYLVAYEAVLYPKILANQYQLVAPASYHNQLVNAGIREKGHCYHFAQDMMKHLDRPYKTLTLERVMANQGQDYEHHAPSIRANGQDLPDAIVLDAWINSSDLSWVKIKEDNGYPWEKYYPRIIKSAKSAMPLPNKQTALHMSKI